MRTYGKPGSTRLTPFKAGYLSGVRGGMELGHTLRGGRARRDYERGYCCGLYWATVYSLTKEKATNLKEDVYEQQ